MVFGSVKVLCKSEVTVIVCCGACKLHSSFPFIPVRYEVVRDHSGQRDKSGMLLVKWLLTEIIVVKLSLLTSTGFFFVSQLIPASVEIGKALVLVSIPAFCTIPSSGTSLTCAGLNNLEVCELRSLKTRQL